MDMDGFIRDGCGDDMIGKLFCVTERKAPMFGKDLEWIVLMAGDVVMVLSFSQGFGAEVRVLSARGTGEVCKKYLTQI